MKHIALLIWMLCALAPVLVGQDGSFTATVDQNKVAAGEQFALTFTVSGSDFNSIRNFKAPDFGPFVVLTGPNQSTNMQWINGKMSASVAYTYALYARATGKYSIGAASVEYRGAVLKTQPVTIEVSQGKPQQPQAAQQKQDPAASVGDNLVIRASVDKSRVRQGEQLIVTYRLLTRVSVSGYDLAKAPTFEGFWSEDFQIPTPPQLTTETIDGKQYRVALIKKTALFASQTGVLKIAPLEVRAAVQVQSKKRSNDPFDAFFNDPFFQQMQTVNYDFKSNPLTITVDPLPGGAPAGFSGGVGRYAFSASVDKKSVKAGDAITLRLTLIGSGNIKLVSLPKPALPADMEAYDPKVSEEITRDAGLIRGKKTAEYLLIPRNPGNRTIDPIAFTYFDLDSRSYQTMRSPKFEFTITPGRDVSGGVSIAAKEDVRLLGEDIRFLKLDMGSLLEPHASPYQRWWWWLGLILPPIAFGGAAVYRRRLERMYGNLPQLRFEKAGREASKRLKAAQQLLARGNAEQYHAEVGRALLAYLEHKLRTPKSTLTIEAAAEKLAAGGVSADVIAKTTACVERAEFVRYAPSADSQEARKDLLEQASAAISAIEREFGGAR